MRFCVLSSGSEGNCYLVETGEYRFLIDLGLSAKIIEERLWDKGVDPDSISAIYITHEHVDHMKGAGIWSRRYRVPIFATKGTWEMMEKGLGAVEKRFHLQLERGKRYAIGDYVIESIPTYHDAKESCAYGVEYGGKRILVMTDTGMVDGPMEARLKRADIAVIESNHDLPMLLEGPYPEALKARIRGNFGHLSNQDCSALLCRVLRENPEGIFLLGHLSDENNRPSLALRTAREALFAAGIREARVEVLERGKASDMYEI